MKSLFGPEAPLTSVKVNDAQPGSLTFWPETTLAPRQTSASPASQYLEHRSLMNPSVCFSLPFGWACLPIIPPALHLPSFAGHADPDAQPAQASMSVATATAKTRAIPETLPSGWG